jgi:lambda family phage tail tape measure protein
MGRQLLKTLQQIIANQIALSILRSLFGGIAGAPAGGNLGGQDVGELAGAAPASFAAGGYTGPGGKYQPAGIVHAGEFVINREATAANFEVLAAINEGAYAVAPQSFAPRSYASGGFVESMGGGDLGTATIGLEEGLVAKHVDSVFLKVANKHRRSLGTILRGQKP